MSWNSGPPTRPDTRAPSRPGATQRQTAGAGQVVATIIRAVAPWLIGTVFVLLMFDLVVHMATSLLIGLVPMLVLLAVIRAVRR